MAYSTKQAVMVDCVCIPIDHFEDLHQYIVDMCVKENQYADSLEESTGKCVRVCHIFNRNEYDSRLAGIYFAVRNLGLDVEFKYTDENFRRYRAVYLMGKRKNLPPSTILPYLSRTRKVL